MMPNSMLQPSPISTTLAFSSRVVWFCSVALILSISALVITVAVVGFRGLGWAMTAIGTRTAAASKTFSAVFFIVFLLNMSSPSGAVSQLHIVSILMDILNPARWETIAWRPRDPARVYEEE